MDQDTSIGGAAHAFPATGLSLLVRAADENPSARRAALDRLISAYWKPVYKYVRLRWRAGNEDAKDWTQEFFAVALEREYLQKYDPSRSRFRTYLRVCIDGFVANQLKAGQRAKRGGGVETLSLDFGSADADLASQAGVTDPEELFHREWTRSLFQTAVETLEKECCLKGRPEVFAVFARYDLDPPVEKKTYREMADELGITPTQLNNYLALARRRFRELVLSQLGEICATEAEFRAEAALLFGAVPK
ncbi:MAG: sigma-70 family RNA polymerase sigma factor [Acidobacteria bacterium]|nr:MAG: sigma-70 family RNA polymerase sigma factor [Acidobacteriota bacterium]